MRIGQLSGNKQGNRKMQGKPRRNNKLFIFPNIHILLSVFVNPLYSHKLYSPLTIISNKLINRKTTTLQSINNETKNSNLISKCPFHS